ncbi:hypothetical protein F4677DRAFT_281540 [Hypoxylon crocopeplum]|nr:hypothetical protein F4677DRAFT_281540 [Hypoxylon crocopeplum]
MCRYWLVSRFCCGHEQVAADSEPSSFCLFQQTGGICGRELGRFRVFEVFLNEYCDRCSSTLAAIERNNSYKSKFSLDSASSVCASSIEIDTQNAARARLKSTSGMPRRPAVKRLRQLNNIARENLQEYLKRDDAYATPMFAWVLRYIASLPLWLDRRGLVNELEPWFGPLLDEDQQICLRPALRSMDCEDTLNDIMVWRRDE